MAGYIVGDISRLIVTFTDINGDLADPSTVTLVVQSPDNSQASVASGDIIRDSLGLYHSDVLLAQAGTFYYRWDGEGSVTAVNEGSVYAAPTMLIPHAYYPQ